MNINDVFIKCVEKWAENELDDRINFAMDKFDDWIKDFDEEEKDILCKILEKFNYYPLGNINKLIKELSDESRKVFGVSNDDSVIKAEYYYYDNYSGKLLRYYSPLSCKGREYEYLK